MHDAVWKRGLMKTWNPANLCAKTNSHYTSVISGWALKEAEQECFRFSFFETPAFKTQL